MKFGAVTLPDVSVPEWVRGRSSPKLLVGLGLGWLTLFFIAPVIVLFVESLNFGGAISSPTTETL